MSIKQVVYHITHLDNISSIIEDGYIYSDQILNNSNSLTTIIGMSKIKKRRLLENRLRLYPELFVGDCVPFYFNNRMPMLYLMKQNNHPEMSYSGGQEPIVHLVFDMNKIVKWAEKNGKHWLFTDSNAGSSKFNEFNNLSDIHSLNWVAIYAMQWKSCIEMKQAEFLVQDYIPINLIESIGTYSAYYRRSLKEILKNTAFEDMKITVETSWYY